MESEKEGSEKLVRRREREREREHLEYLKGRFFLIAL
jgi:hypothetical protein